MPTDPGARLRRQREQAGLTEQQVAEQLNLDAGLVQALERNDYAALGAPVFVRGHLRRYSTLVGADAAQILAAYDRSSAGPGQPTLIPRAREEMRPAQRRSPIPWIVAGGLVLLVAVGGLAWFAFDAWRASRSARADEAAPPASTVAVAPAAPAAPAPAGQVAVAFAFSADSWIEVYDASGRTVVYDLGKAGTQRIASGTPPLSVTLGNAPAVAMDVNGRRATVPAPEAGSTVTHFAVGADGMPRPAVEERT
ncbi:MAG: DUF4115 domain-containing protein [Steroidobacteraceae bacterium]